MTSSDSVVSSTVSPACSDLSWVRSGIHNFCCLGYSERRILKLISSHLTRALVKVLFWLETGFWVTLIVVTAVVVVHQEVSGCLNLGVNFFLSIFKVFWKEGRVGCSMWYIWVLHDHWILSDLLEKLIYGWGSHFGGGGNRRTLLEHTALPLIWGTSLKFRQIFWLSSLEEWLLLLLLLFSHKRLLGYSVIR